MEDKKKWVNFYPYTNSPLRFMYTMLWFVDK